MTTIVNTPPQSQDSIGGIGGMVIGVVVLVFLGFIFFVYGLPVIRGSMSPQVNIPNKIDVNVSGTTK